MITSFTGEYAFLSNFYFSNPSPTVEHHYQAAKTLNLAERRQILLARTPYIAKLLGRRVHIRVDWEHVKVQIMRNLLEQKFAERSELANKLLLTEQEPLIEGNSWGDQTWGAVWNGTDWVGKNLLGALLMERRKSLQGYMVHSPVVDCSSDSNQMILF